MHPNTPKRSRSLSARNSETSVSLHAMEIPHASSTADLNTLAELKAQPELTQPQRTLWHLRLLSQLELAVAQMVLSTLVLEDLTPLPRPIRAPALLVLTTVAHKLH